MDKSGIQREIPFVVQIRTISVFLILLCHLVQAHTNPYVVMSSQLFNVGVEIFIIISGFLSGHLGIQKPYRKWIIKRLKRIYLPFWLFLVIILGIQYAQGVKIDVASVVFSIAGMQGFRYVFPGSEHTWFVTAFLLCYLITPLLDTVVEKINNDKRKKYGAVLLGILLAAPSVAAFLPGAAIIQMCIFYCLAFLLGKKWETIRITKSLAVCCAVGALVAFTIRFFARFYIDGTVFYSGIVVTYTHFAAALGFFLASSRWLDRKPWKVVSFISKKSFEMYLYHYMFIWPPLTVMALTRNWIINSAVVVLLSFAVAIVMNALLEGLCRLYKNWTKENCK